MGYRYSLENDDTVIRFLENYELGVNVSDLYGYASIATFGYAERLADYNRKHMQFKITWSRKYVDIVDAAARRNKKLTVKEIESALISSKEIIALMEAQVEAENEMEKYKAINLLLSSIIKSANTINT